MAKPALHVCGDLKELQDKVIEAVLSISETSIKDHGFFTIGVSGGSVAKILSNGLRNAQAQPEWNKWYVLFCDERHVPFSDSDSTYAVYKRDLFDHVNLPSERVIAIKPDLTVEQAAEDYTERISNLQTGIDSIPSFDLLVLGMGPDGHTCSLFPGHPGLTVTDKVVIPIKDSPKPPPSRITLTFPVLNAAKSVFVIATGENKATAVKDCLKPENGESPLPAGMVQPSNGVLQWFLDPPAGAKL